MSLDLLTILPEIIILIMAISLLILEAFKPKNSASYAFILTLISLVIAGGLLLSNMPEKTSYLLNGALVHDKLSVSLKFVILLVSLIVFLYSKAYLNDRGIDKTEYYSLALFSILGMLVMVGGSSMLSLYMGLELMSLALYALVAMLRDDRKSNEAAMKYFVLGAVASGMLLYGMSFVYGLTGSLDLNVIASKLPDGSMMTTFGLIFIVAGLAFKLGAVPFHMWLPDVYEGSPTAVTMFISAAPKIAGFAMIIRLLDEGMGNVSADWQEILMVISVLSIALGNIVAIAQTNFKRMLAYSGIAHMGFFLLGMVAGSTAGNVASMFYVIVYALTSLAGFGIIILLSKKGFEADKLTDYKGLSKTHPWYAFMTLIVIFSMAGIPPTVGFYAKLSVLQAVIDANMAWLAVIAVVFSIIGAYYYLRMVAYMYFSDAEVTDQKLKPVSSVGFLFSLNALSILLLGLFPAILLTFCLQAIAG